MKILSISTLTGAAVGAAMLVHTGSTFSAGTANTVEVEAVSNAQLTLTHVNDFGTTLPTIFSRKVAPQLHNIRINVNAERELTGQLTGSMSSTNYINVRPDNRFELNGLTFIGEGNVNPATGAVQMTLLKPKFTI